MLHARARPSYANLAPTKLSTVSSLGPGIIAIDRLRNPKSVAVDRVLGRMILDFEVLLQTWEETLVPTTFKVIDAHTEIQRPRTAVIRLTSIIDVVNGKRWCSFYPLPATYSGANNRRPMACYACMCAELDVIIWFNLPLQARNGRLVYIPTYAIRTRSISSELPTPADR